MARLSLPRRTVSFGIAAFGFVPLRAVASEEVVDLEWSDLVPKGETSLPAELQGLVQHDQGALMSQQPQSSGVRTDWNGRTVRLPGYMVPLDFDGTGVTAFILVPYVGACVHVPPPPANQLVLVTTERPYETDGLFEPVTVTGMFGTAAASTELADVGYALSADNIETYKAR
ncbi:DUF3299 domain-containing protein [Tropicimonas isoalkanivorans]|uniref:DUF3299 domain-containing protein n=1 Tax=Tropicimonas isoalkanivorans TaxID=441112 RepID=A0A1I1DVS0_9RHOB|nr:DUF3299 domain-containing protein [Tropicimonas isoalkanivorans]SFB77108.1 hypothetical protein SAMN04488094_101415 [Tropicimonas isoalkanivorans]